MNTPDSLNTESKN